MLAARNIHRPDSEILREVGAALEELDRAEILALLVYGSALGRYIRPDSDLDVAVLDRPEKPASEATLARIMSAIERQTGYEVDLRRMADLSISHQAHILEQGQPVWVGDPQALEATRREVLRRNVEQHLVSKQRWPALLERLGRGHAAR